MRQEPVSHFTLTQPAEVDLSELLAFIADDSIRAAERLRVDLLDSCQRLAAAPGIGRSRPELGEGVRSWPVGNYLIFFRQAPNGVVVLRLLHGARDIEKQFGLPGL